MMHAWGTFVARRAAWVLTGGLIAVVAAAIFGLGAFASLSNGGFDDPDTESAQSLAAEQASFDSHDADVIATYASDTMSAQDPRFRAAVADVVDQLPIDPVARVVPYYAEQAEGLVSTDGRAGTVVITLVGESQDEKTDAYAQIEDKLEAEGLTTYIGGPWAVFDDVNETVSEDIARAESLTMPIVFVLCLIIFGSVVAAFMPVLIGAVAVFGAFAVIRLITTMTEVSVFAINIVTLIGMGLAIDYALFVVSRFREELARQPGTERSHVEAAAVATMETAGRTVLFSGLTVAASLASLLIFPQSFLTSMGYGGVAAVLVAMVAALTLLPALLVVLGRRVEFGRMPWRRRTTVARSAGAWARIGHSVMRRPVAYLVVITVALLALGSPFLRVAWGSVDHRVLPDDSPSHVAAAFQTAEFGGETSRASIVVTGAERATLETYVDRLGDVAGVESARPIDSSSNDVGPVDLVQVQWSGNGQTEESQQLVERLRAVDPGDGVITQVGGTSAETVDLINSIGAHLPWMAITVIAVMLVLLFLAFGSVVLPLKAVVMNAVSIAASFGIVTWIFADGNLSGLLGFTSTGFLDVTQPILMLAILFGLSMDYEVFLLSRIREEWDRTHDNTAAVASGLQRTGAIITSAALLLAVVIGGFATSGIVFMKMIGIGMLIAVLLDATAVRALLVPATMRLLGPSNWWAPAPIARWWSRHGLHESGPDVAPVAGDSQELSPSTYAGGR